MATGSLTPDPGSIQIVPDPGSIQPVTQQPAMTHPKWNKAQPNPKVIDLLTRLGQASTNAIEHGPGSGFHTLLHSESPQQYQTDTADITRKMMGATPDEYAHLNPARRGANEFATQFITDPLTILDPLIGGLSRSAATHAMPLAMRASQAAAKSPIHAVSTAAEAAAHLGGKAHNFFTAGGENAAHALREEALRNGPQGVENYRRLYSLRGAADAQASDLHNALSQGFRRAIQGLPENDRLTVYRAIHNGGIDKLPENLQNAAKQIVTYDRAIPYLNGTKAVRTQMQKQYGYSLPKDLERFDIGTQFAPPNARGTIRTNQFMQNHIPLPHELEAEDAARIERALSKGSKRDLADAKNLQFKRRRPQDPDSTFLPIDDASVIEDLFHSSFRRAGKQLAASDLQQRVADLFGKPQQLNVKLGTVTPEDLAKGAKLRTNANQADLSFVKRREPALNAVSPTKTGTAKLNRYADVPAHIKQFFVENGKGGTGNLALDEILGGAKGLSDISRSTLFTTPFPHQARIASLLALHAPEALPSAIGKYIRTGLGFAGPEQQAKAFGEARHMGATGLPNVEQSRLQDVLAKLGGPGKAASKYYGGVGKMLWGWDNAAKAALYERNLKQYGDPLLAAYHTQQALVNYEKPSPFISASRTVESFPTWRNRMPGAVLKGIMEHPRNAAAIARLLGGVGFGAAVAADGKERKASSSALGEAAQLLDDPRAYLRGSLSPGGKLGASAAAATLKSDNPQYWTYNKNPLEFLFNELPVVNQVAPYTGHGMFKTTPDDQLLMQLLGIQTLEPQAKSRHRRRHHARR